MSYILHACSTITFPNAFHRPLRAEMARNKSSSSSSSSSSNTSDAVTPTLPTSKQSPDDGMYLYFSAMGKSEEKKSAIAELMYAEEVRRGKTADDLVERRLCLEEKKQKLEEESLAFEIAKFNALHN